MEKSAVAYRVNGRLVIAPMVRTTSGVFLEIDPSDLGACPDQEAVKAALTSALAQSGRVVQHPKQTEWKGFFDPFLKAAGVRSYKAFMATAQSLHIDEQAGSLIITPNRNLGAREGFESVLADRKTVFDSSAAAEAVLELLPQS